MSSIPSEGSEHHEVLLFWEYLGRDTSGLSYIVHIENESIGIVGKLEKLGKNALWALVSITA